MYCRSVPVCRRGPEEGYSHITQLAPGRHRIQGSVDAAPMEKTGEMSKVRNGLHTNENLSVIGLWYFFGVPIAPLLTSIRLNTTVLITIQHYTTQIGRIPWIH